MAAHLEAQGLAILATKLHVGRAEIDLLAREGVVIVIVEVRARGPGAWVGALGSVDAKKRARLREAGEKLWQTRFAADASVERMRFDVAAVEVGADGQARIEIIRAAF